MKRICAGLITAVFLITACSERPTVKKNDIVEYIGHYPTDISGPSGLALSYDKSFLWTVSDTDKRLYKISFEGKTLDKIKVDAEDMEGVTVIDSTTLAVVLEKERAVLLISNDGKEITKKKYKDIKGNGNAGLEGITYNSSTGGFYLLKEKKPTLLITTDNDLNIIDTKELKIADDLSGICYEPLHNNLWIVSHEDKMIANCDLKGSIIDSFRVNIPQIEGISVDYETGKMYVICDETADLFVYDLLDRKKAKE